MQTRQDKNCIRPPSLDFSDHPIQYLSIAKASLAETLPITLSYKHPFPIGSPPALIWPLKFEAYRLKEKLI